MAFNSLLKGEGLTMLKDNVNLAVLKLEGIEFRDLKFPAEESYRGGWKENRVRRAAGSGCRRPPTAAATRRCHPPPPACLPGPPACTSTSAGPPVPRPPHPPDVQPEGEGCYTWADSSTYEGAWHEGLKHGWGKYCWPNGACYQGEWRDGFMQVGGWVGGRGMLGCQNSAGRHSGCGRLAAQAECAALRARRLLAAASRLGGARCARWATAAACAASYLTHPPTSSPPGLPPHPRNRTTGVWHF